MKKDLEIWQFAAERLLQNESATLLVVAESSGSSPGRQGFKMIVAKDDLCGSVGGGVMEVRLTGLAKELLESEIKNAKSLLKSQIPNPKSRIIEQVHQKNSPNQSGMICSGKQTVIFRRLDFNDLTVINEIIDALKNHRSKTLQITDYELQIEETEQSVSDFTFEKQNENEFAYREKLGDKNELYIVGGGHCALALSELMAKMDFYISLFDDRPNLNTIAKNEFADRITVVESYEKIGDYVESGANVYVVVMTLGYQSDETVIKKLIDKNFKYFGVLGSKAKMTTLLRELKNEGFAAEKLNRIRTPAGIEINSRTPEEIAVSIAAEIIRAKNAK